MNRSRADTAAVEHPSIAPRADADERFEFGENWRRFLEVVDDDRIADAETSLREMLQTPELEGRTFLDLGCGSGLFSLAAMRLGARAVRSIDFDGESVACTRELKRRHFPDSPAWRVEQGSVLDDVYMGTLGRYDVVYAWGVLHHTGDMAHAMENAALAVRPGGRLFISIYNDQGRRSRVWRRVKRLYNRVPRRLRGAYVVIAVAPWEGRAALRALVTLRPHRYVRNWTRYRRENRGMSRWHDHVDWVGGYPFEVATPERVFEFYKTRGFQLERLVTRQGHGCNEFVFTRS